MSKSQRDKGARREREAFALLQDHFGTIVTRNYGQSALGGLDMAIGDVFGVEVKARAGIAVYPWLDQITEACKESKRIPIVLARADRREPIVIMHAVDAFRLMRGEI